MPGSVKAVVSVNLSRASADSMGSEVNPRLSLPFSLPAPEP